MKRTGLSALGAVAVMPIVSPGPANSADRPKLPPGIAKRQLPAALKSQLPPAPAGFGRSTIDNDLVLVEITTQLVHDIISK